MSFFNAMSQTGSMYRTSLLLLQRDVSLAGSLRGPSSVLNFRRSLSSGTDLKKTCLFEFHTKRQARMEPFAGHMMPIVYKNQTIKSEHLHTREAASAFDVSHMMQTIVRGVNRNQFLEHLTVADIEAMGLNKCVLSMFTNQSGGIIDDCIISMRKDHIHIVSNAGNAEIVWSWLNSNISRFDDVALERLDGRGLIALQGPKAAEVLQERVDLNLSELEFMNTADADINSIGSCQITRCGYTGEDGFEISVASSTADKLMNLLCQQSTVRPAGLGARDTLRLEAGLCLHGHDITDKTTPIESNLNWTISKRRRSEGNFIGANVILDQLKKGVERKRAGIVSTGAGPPAREGSQITDGDSKVLGVVTSGTYAPSLGKNIAMGYMDANLTANYNALVYANVRGKVYEYKVTKMPFVKSNYYVKTK